MTKMNVNQKRSIEKRTFKKYLTFSFLKNGDFSLMTKAINESLQLNKRNLFRLKIIFHL